jgi:hypothetical protein
MFVTSNLQDLVPKEHIVYKNDHSIYSHVISMRGIFFVRCTVSELVGDVVMDGWFRVAGHTVTPVRDTTGTETWPVSIGISTLPSRHPY